MLQSTETPFTEDYFLRGPETGLSNYRDYRWLPDLTIPACRRVMNHLGCKAGDKLLDYGASRGYYVKAYRMLGLNAWGYDISEWAVGHCDDSVRQWMSTTFPLRAFDWAVAKDVFEHIPREELASILSALSGMITKGILIIVPLTQDSNGRYLRHEDEKDSTHVLRWTFEDWMDFLEASSPDFDVHGSFHIEGIKPASSQVRHSCGFFTLKKQ